MQILYDILHKYKKPRDEKEVFTLMSQILELEGQILRKAIGQVFAPTEYVKKVIETVDIIFRMMPTVFSELLEIQSMNTIHNMNSIADSIVNHLYQNENDAENTTEDNDKEGLIV